MGREGATAEGGVATREGCHQGPFDGAPHRQAEPYELSGNVIDGRAGEPGR